MKNINPNVEKLLELGKESLFEVDYKELGLLYSDKEDLLSVIFDDNLHFSNKNRNYPYAPIHAIYALGKLEIEETFDEVSKLINRYDDDYLANAIVDYAKDLNCLNKINFIPSFYKALNREVKKEEVIEKTPEPVVEKEEVVEKAPEPVVAKEEVVEKAPEPIIKKEEEVIVIETDELIKEAINEMHDKDDNKPAVKKGRAPVKEPVKHIKVGRNEPCPCGSGKKYKKCCLNS
ncbi:hypothetical protein MNB_SV-9-1605 [hydrothermal vent metagenome]|uniref:Protein export cytoplasm protein SecA ATPase RNA helicase (TC 3.A.5.1.1) n=1 Tax=hydrothermal vent metagenome TaxID=652676 RepID=A0A1W1BPK5_9ZZZZ